MNHSEPSKSRLTKAKERLMARFPIDTIRRIPKYRNLNNDQYVLLIDKLERLAIILLESYIFTLNDQP